MKKRIVRVTTIPACIAAAFLAGRFSGEKTDYEKGVEFVQSVVDWNTNGEEISILTDADLEFYAYKGAER